ncbi:MAG: 4a-hydroxytetrahydrobiopterin dehydratase [Bacteroidia bacterium]|nr:4a-hydroxytetrahydrobiopterin dehydratase [Bacteroidia bacterium]
MHRKYTFSSFKLALSFMNECIDSIDSLNHHPEWSNSYNKVYVILKTHDAGNVVTDKDYALAAILEDIYLARF